MTYSMTSPTTPTRRVSDLVSFFQQPPAPSSPSPSSFPSPSTSTAEAPSRPIPTSRRTLPSPPPPVASPAAAVPSRIAPVRSGTVGQHVRRFSVERAPDTSSSSPKSEMQKGRVGAMDWTPRASPNSISPSPAPPTPPSPSTKPSTSGSSRPAAKLFLADFQPRRTAPLPPSTSSQPAATVLVPATVSNDGQGGRIKMNIQPTIARAPSKEAASVVGEGRLGAAPKTEVAGAFSEAACQPQEPAPSRTITSKRKPPPSTINTLHSSSRFNVFPTRSSTLQSPLQAAETEPLAALINSDSSPQLTPLSALTPLPTASPFAVVDSAEVSSVHPLLAPSPPPTRPHLHHSTTTSPTAPLLAPRPPLSHHSTSLTFASTSTQHLPAAQLFASTAEPLVLPFVDQALRDLGGAARFTPVESLPWGKEEKKGWEEWVREGEKEGLWKRWGRSLGLMGRSSTRGGYNDLEKESGSSTFDSTVAERQRALIFPPMHLVPPKMTVTDLKRNQLTPMAIVGLQAIVQNAANGVLAAAGSTYGINLTTVEMFRDLMQMITLLTSASSATGTSSSWYNTLFYTFPSAISLDFVSAFGKAILWLWVFTGIVAVVVYELWCFTGGWGGPSSATRDDGEGFDRESAGVGQGTRKRWWKGWRQSYAYKVAITFIATSFYLPLSKLAIGALFWTSDYWPVENPYLTTDTPSPAPLGPSDKFRDPLSFCYRTTMLRPSGLLGNFNWAFLILPISALTIGWLTIFLPWRLHQVAQRERPRVDPWTEMGEKRRDVEGEYRRLVEVDRSPFGFLYREYRRPWASFKSIYMMIKLLNVLLIVIIQKENCAFRHYTTVYLSVVRQGSLVAFMSLFLLSMRASKPLADVISNTSDFISRIGYVLIAVIGLLVALDVNGKAALGGPVLIFVNVVVYAMNGYFSLIGTDAAQRVVKRLQHRLDTSIDLFSPHLDLAKHLSRRIWHETFSTILLAGPEYKMPADEKLAFSVDPYLPPYLLGFRGTAGERHVENLKILREIGLEAYGAAMQARELDPDSKVHHMRRTIQYRFTGPDVYWQPPHRAAPSSVTTFFGRLDVIPFPFVVVFRYDQDPLHPIRMTETDDLAHLVHQNESAEVANRRRVRLALRALEGEAVFAPHVEIKSVGKRDGVEVQARIQYRMGILSIGRNSAQLWNGYNHSSGFDVLLHYSDGQGQDSDGKLRYGQQSTLDGAALGVDDDFALTPSVAKLFKRNRDLLEARLPLLESTLAQHRDFFRHEAEGKERALSYSFLFNVVAEDSLTLSRMGKVLEDGEQSRVVREMVGRYGASLTLLEERMTSVRSSKVRAWWYLLWDDLWRRNTDVAQIGAFSPHYRGSVCYHPMPRADLERFLDQHGLPSSSGRSDFSPGFLNKIYFYLAELIFSGTSQAIPIHLAGHHPSPLAFDHLLLPHQHLPPQLPPSHRPPTHPPHLPQQDSSHFTGGGTDHDDPSLQPRGAFPFEWLYEGPSKGWGERVRRWLGLVHVVHEGEEGEREEVVFDLKRGRGGVGGPEREGRGRRGEG